MAHRRIKKRANLRDVATAAEVSVATVSRVLNSPDVVQKDTRAKVERIIAELGFRPSAAARAINSGRTRIIGALIPTLENDIFALTIEAIENRLGDFGYSLVVATTGEDPNDEARRAKELLDIGAEGIFFPGVTHSPELFAMLEYANVPAVAISYFERGFTYPTIGYDNKEAARMALSHLTELGHRNIAVIHGPTERNDRTRARLDGLKEAPQDVVLHYFETDLSVAGGAIAVREAQVTGKKYDAYLCTSDAQAFGVMFELQRLGLRIPEDTSLIGLHDLPTAEFTNPRLTTIRLPARTMGRMAAEALAKWLDTGQRPVPICLATTLKDRDTTARREP